MLYCSAFPALADLLLFIENIGKCHMIEITESVDNWFFFFFNSICDSMLKSVIDFLFVDWTKYVASACTSLFKHKLVILIGHCFV